MDKKGKIHLQKEGRDIVASQRSKSDPEAGNPPYAAPVTVRPPQERRTDSISFGKREGPGASEIQTRRNQWGLLRFEP